VPVTALINPPKITIAFCEGIKAAACALLFNGFSPAGSTSGSQVLLGISNILRSFKYIEFLLS
jgi:hypothetical protein